MHYSKYFLNSILCLAVLILVAGDAHAVPADHLIITEIVAKTRTPYTTFGSPYIQIVNPTADDIDMGQVHITDGTTAPVAFYYYLTLGDPAANNPGGGNGGDFHARFPTGYVLAAGDSLALSINGSTQYQEAYGRLPDFELFEDSAEPDGIPEMVEVFPGSIDAGPLAGSNVPELSDIAESIMLYTWDGTSDLVQDLDYLVWGTSTAVRIDKTDVSINSSSYVADTPVGDQENVSPAGPGFRRALRRVSADEGAETIAGGNGLTGHDETSENLSATWQDVDVLYAGSIVPTEPASWYPAAPIFLSGSNNPQIPSHDQPVQLGVSIASYSTINNLTFHYNVNGGVFVDLIGTEVPGSRYYVNIPPQNEGSNIAWYCTAENEDGGVSVYPAEAPNYTVGWTVAAPSDPSFVPTKLFITEVFCYSSVCDFVEICNPSEQDVDMSNYYLGDAVYLNYRGYWNIGAGAGLFTTGGGRDSDFQARFPDGFVISAGDTIIMSMSPGSHFEDCFGYPPQVELLQYGYEGGTVPEMRPVFETETGNSIVEFNNPDYSMPSLYNPGESLVLYHWIEGDDLVTDIDLFVWGTGGDYTIDKTGLVVGNSTYQPDNPLETFLTVAGSGQSYNRVDASEGLQIPFGSNGVWGRDETSENWSVTFEVRLANPALGPGPFPVEGAWQNIWPPSDDPGTPSNHAWFGYNGGWDEDLHLVNSQIGYSDILYFSQGDGAFFPLVTQEPFSTGQARAVSWADLDYDFDQDLMIVQSPGPTLCFENISNYWHNTYFTPITGGGLAAEDFSVAGAWVDYDHDGQLEMFIANENSAAQMLFSQYGFFDMTPMALKFQDGCQNFSWCDFDVDMDSDLCVLTTEGQIHILTNLGGDQFQDDIYQAASGCTNSAWGDFDNDGDFDLLVTVADGPNLLLENLNQAGFQVAELPALGGSHDSREAVWGDYDNDGFLDIFVANCGAPSLLLRNDSGTGNFIPVIDGDVSPAGDCVAVSWADIDRDGDLDLFLSGLPQNQLLRNNIENGNTYLRINLDGHFSGNLSNRSAVGALVKVTTGDQIQWRSVAGDGSSISQHFGLGDATLVDEITVYWPYEMLNGEHHTTRLQNVNTNIMLLIEEPMLGLSSAEDVQLPAAFALLPCHPNPFNPMTTIAFEVPQTGEINLEIFDVAGRRVRTLYAGVSFAAGAHTVTWQGRDNQGRSLASGVYQVRLKAGDFQGVQRVTLVK